jgi:hypothetical protein
MKEDQKMINLLSEEQLQEIQGGSEEEKMKMKVLSSPIALGGTESWLKGLRLTYARSSSQNAQKNISDAIKHRQEGNVEAAHSSENAARTNLAEAKSSVNDAWARHRRR